MLSATNLTKRCGSKTVVDQVSLHVRSGEVIGLLGPNGAGKTTTVGMLYGLVVPDAGTVQLGSFDLHREPKEARGIIGVVPQEDNLDPDFTAEENLIRFATYYGLSWSEATERADELLRLVGLQEHRNKEIHELSGGMKRRLVLGRALLNRPQILFLDEPTTGLDPDARQDFWKVVLQLKQSGAALLVTTNYMEEAERLCDRVLLIQRGRILDEDTPRKLSEKYVGDEVVEVHGVVHAELENLRLRHSTWMRNYSVGFILGVPRGTASAFMDDVEALNPTQLLKRRANLEDVFLTLTGEHLK